MNSNVVQPERQAAYIFRYEGEDGSVVDATVDQATPLGIGELRSIELNRPTALSLQLQSTSVTRNGERLTGSHQLTINGLALHKLPKLFALLEDGWLPPMLVTSRQFLLDSNIIIDLEDYPKNSDGS